MSWATDALALLACPACHGRLEWAASDAECMQCGASYPSDHGVPVLVAPAPGPTSASSVKQFHFFEEEVDAEFETRRPHGTPRFHSWLLEEKFRRSVSELHSLADAHGTALTVCGGSGMDAEFLARAGFRVIASDVSRAAAARARERFRRFGLDALALAADVERLPFRSSSIDLVYVHDGLHHLEQPLRGLGEMARVARLGVSVTEPARAAITRVAIVLGIAGEYEDAGNRVARLTTDEVERGLEEAGFRIAKTGRYGMYYRHEPGRLATGLSMAPTLPIARLLFHAGNAVAGRIGNKLTVQALRSDDLVRVRTSRTAQRAMPRAAG